MRNVVPDSLCGKVALNGGKAALKARNIHIYSIMKYEKYRCILCILNLIILLQKMTEI